MLESLFLYPTNVHFSGSLYPATLPFTLCSLAKLEGLLKDSGLMFLMNLSFEECLNFGEALESVSLREEWEPWLSVRSRRSGTSVTLVVVVTGIGINQSVNTHILLGLPDVN